MKIKIVALFFLFLVFSINSANAESNAQNITIKLHQIWDFSSETDVTVTDIIRTNEDCTIPGNIGLAPNVEVVDYYQYFEDINNSPVLTIYRPTNGNSVQVPNLLLEKNGTLIRKYTILGASTPTNHLSFPFDEYDFSLALMVKDYNQIYSADFIFPASFEFKNKSLSRPFIEQWKNEDDIQLTLVAIRISTTISESKSVEKFKAYIPSINIPNSAQTTKYFVHTQNPNKNFLEIKFTYGRPELFIYIFFISLIFMLSVTYLSCPKIEDKEGLKKYFLNIGSIWAAQEGVSLLQGVRPLEWTLYDYTIFIILIPLFLDMRFLKLQIILLIQNKIIYIKQKLKNIYELMA